MRSDLKRDEGFRNKIYIDTTNHASAGVGRNLTDKGLRDDEIELMLTNDIAEASHELDRMCSFWVNLPEPAARGLLNCMFNLGAPRLLGFKKMLAALEAHNWDAAAQEAMQSSWSAQVGSRAQRVADLFLSCKYV